MHHELRLHRRFWRGEGPSLLLIPAARNSLYDLDDYPRRFRDPQAMWESEMARARPVVDWPTDGVPTVRPNLGVTFVPAMAGLPFNLPEGAMPWPGEPLSEDTIRAARDLAVTETETYRLAAEFYAVHRQSGEARIAAYQADTQGVFDIAHLLYGDEIFYALANPDCAEWIDELMDLSADLYVRASEAMKADLREEPGVMMHGHGTPQGVSFPHAGVRMAEDTATLLSPGMIERHILPVVRSCAEPFAGVFVHYCGRHASLFAQLTAMPEVKAIDLGNPESHCSEDVLRRCAETDTVLYSRLAAETGEAWKDYVIRLGKLAARRGARVILRPVVFPDTREECAAMLDLWHELTA